MATKSPDSRPGDTVESRGHRTAKLAASAEYAAQKGLAGGKVTKSANRQTSLQRAQNRQVLGNFHRGGKVHKTGIYKLEKGEKVERKRGSK